MKASVYEDKRRQQQRQKSFANRVHYNNRPTAYDKYIETESSGRSYDRDRRQRTPSIGEVDDSAYMEMSPHYRDRGMKKHHSGKAKNYAGAQNYESDNRRADRD